MIRKAYSNLLNWKNKTKRKPLLVLGVRQCGKTYLIKQFGNMEFENMAYCSFDGNDGLKSVFDYDFDTRRILSELSSVVVGQDIIPNCNCSVTEILLDEETKPIELVRWADGTHLHGDAAKIVESYPVREVGENVRERIK